MSSLRPNIVPQRHVCNIGEVINSRYTIVSELGEGSFGHVYKVKDASGAIYALKLLHLWDVPSDIRQSLVDRFEMEYKTGRIQSEYLVHSVDIGYLEGNPYIVMEFCSGGDLCKKMGDDGAQTAKYAFEILCGLNDLHTNGKVHRDLKPENVLIKANGVAALTDFGIAGDRNKRMTERNIFGRPYQVFGTYAYMPPEQVSRARGGSTVLPTTDIFSFGVMLYQLVTGKLPFGKLDDQNDLVWYQKKGKAGDWDRVSLYQKPRGRQWEAVIDGCLQPDYKLRLQNVGAVMKLMPDFGPAVQNIPSAPVVQNIPQAPVSSHISGFRLLVLQGMEHGAMYDLTAIVNQTRRNIITVGRGDNNTIQLVDYQSFLTSRNHFTIESNPAAGTFIVRDGQWSMEARTWKPSSNGTYVNSTEVQQSGKTLNPGDIITAGEITLRFESY